MDKEYNIVDLFSGYAGFSEAFQRNGCNVLRIDNDPRFKDVPNTRIDDVFTLDPKTLPQRPDFLLMSPPCNTFSVAAIGNYWVQHPRIKKAAMPNENADFSIKLVMRALEIKEIIKPRFWVLENPMGMLRTVLGKPTVTTHFCTWMDSFIDAKIKRLEITFEELEQLNPLYIIIDEEGGIIKPPKKTTDLWGLFPKTMKWPKLEEGTWELSPRGSRCGIQRMKDPARRAYIPYRLSDALYQSLVEHDKHEYEDPDDFQINIYKQELLDQFL